MKKMAYFFAVVICVCMFSGCMSYVNVEENKDTNIPDPKAETEILNNDNKEEKIEPVVVQKLSRDEAKAKVEEVYGGEGVVVKFKGEYEEDELIYYVFDLGSDVSGFFSRDFSIVSDAQSGEMFEGTYDKVNKKIVRY